jgi:hypothetical protein
MSKVCRTLTPVSLKTASNHASLSFVTFDLKGASSICDHLSKHCASTSPCADSCLGYLEYLEATLSSRLIFYDASKNIATQKTQPTPDKETLPISSILQSLRTLHQLTLAHQLAVATLQYHSTSWLAPDWGLHDISYFADTTQQSPDQLLSQLQGLHLSTQFPNTPSNGAHQALQHREDLKYDYGIRNLPLAKLGVALLEIGCQVEDINSLTTAPTPHEVISARRVLRDPPPSMSHLGKRYVNIAQKCIDCDFSCGDDLSDEDLQSAVYTEVVCGLESMVLDWKRFCGIK